MLDATQLFWTQIAAGICLLIFVGLAYNLFRLRGRIEASKSWKKIAGEIVASGVNQPSSHVSDDLNDASAVIRYRYRADGQDLESDRIKISDQPMTTRLLAGALAARYPVGARVDVYMDPSDPKNVALEPRNQDNLVAQLVFTIVFGIIAAVLTAHAIAGKVLYSANGVPLFAFALPILAFLFALVGIAAFVRGQRLARASAGWPMTSGTITTSSVIDEKIEDKSSDDKTRIRTIHRYRVDLRFAYEVGLRDYVGMTRNWGWEPVFGLRELAEKEASHYSQGQKVMVHYDAAQPGNAVLEPNDRKGSLAPLVFAAISAVVGATILAFFIGFGFGA
jgi:hypothetical protein